ncbi:hypothetical protein ABZ605_28070 [Streptomyces sp. NPDC012765]|uniref:hypothetical protein n=1 Tax=Streptomyces sp. NPDC012765 TaxID=3155249 RepID=UPI00340F621D
MSNQADDNNLDAVIYPRYEGSVIFAVSRTGAPTELLDLLDAEGFTRHQEAIYVWHQLREDIPGLQAAAICARAHAALTAAGYTAHLDDRLSVRIR